MSRIVRAVNVMIENADRISDVTGGDRDNQGDYFFQYEGQHIWSISKIAGEDEYHLNFYQGASSASNLAIGPPKERLNVDYVTYSTKDLKTPEARDSLAELYLIVKEKALRVDAALNEIIGSG